MVIDKVEELTKQIYEMQQKKIKQFLSTKNMIITVEDKRNHKSATTCHICEKELGRDKVRDHCHITGKYRGAAHKNVIEIIRF